MIKRLIELYKEKKRILNQQCDDFRNRIDIALAELNILTINKSEFVDPSITDSWRRCHTDLLNNLDLQNIGRFRKAIGYKSIVEKQDQLIAADRSIDKLISQHNEKVANERVTEAYKLIGDVEGRKLDWQQMTCLVKEAHNHLVVAGAGTGKTTTVVGKIKYLLKSGICKPEDILVLSFTNASATEMCERIHKETGFPIEASTFHKLGLNIITKADTIIPQITQLNLRKFIKDQLNELMKNDSYLMLLSSYILFHRVNAKSEFDFASQVEYEAYLRLNPPKTIKNEIVKSYGEMDIANFLNQNGVNYIYEQPYEIDTRTSEYGQYNPDFYLPDYHIYIEYFGINKQGEVPSYFTGSHGMTATEQYRTSMQWKRDLHKQNNTKLLEFFSYERSDNELLDNLKRILEDCGIKLSPKTADELWSQATAEGDSILEGLVELFEAIINLIKSNDDTIATIRQQNIGSRNCRSNDLILSLIEPIYNSYCNCLISRNEIDFNDMINKAATYVKTGKYKNQFRYVIVDEYQDISRARFSLLKAMRDSMDFDLFCVGDDWQSIYRFAGSDIGYILDFSKYWGPTEISKIETTYRFARSLIEISGQFIMQNPMQIIKSIQGSRNDSSFALSEVNGYTEKSAISFLAKKIEDLPQNSTVYFIGRYAFDVNLLHHSESFNCRYNNQTGFVDVVYSLRRDLKMFFITAHRSKGLQADFVVIINNKRSRMGFPSKIQDAPILDMLLSNVEQYPNAEERRLYYVALTRAKKKAIILTVKDQESEFAMELRGKYSEELKKEQFTCPLCGGCLVRKSGPYGDFFGCSSYRTTGCKYKRKIVKNNSSNKQIG